jgi:hypothetical protein
MQIFQPYWRARTSVWRTFCVDAESVRSKEKEAARQYRLENKDRIKDSKRQYRLLNEDRIKEEKLRYRLLNDDKIKEAKQQYYLSNLDKIRKARREHYLRKKSTTTSDNLSKLDDANRESKARYRMNNKEMEREYCRRYDLENEAIRKVYHRRYHARNGEVLREHRRENYVRLHGGDSHHLRPPETIATSVLKRSWNCPSSVREFFESLNNELHISTFSDWYRISRSQMYYLGGICDLGIELSKCNI